MWYDWKERRTVVGRRTEQGPFYLSMTKLIMTICLNGVKDGS